MAGEQDDTPCAGHLHAAVMQGAARLWRAWAGRCCAGRQHERLRRTAAPGPAPGRCPGQLAACCIQPVPAHLLKGLHEVQRSMGVQAAAGLVKQQHGRPLHRHKLLADAAPAGHGCTAGITLQLEQLEVKELADDHNQGALTCGALRR